MYTARGLQPSKASCVCREGGRTTTSFSPNINAISPIITKLNQEVRSSWAYLPYSPRMLKDSESKGNPKCLKNPTANYKPTEATNASCVSCMHFAPCLLQERGREQRATAQPKTKPKRSKNP